MRFLCCGFWMQYEEKQSPSDQLIVRLRSRGVGKDKYTHAHTYIRIYIIYACVERKRGGIRDPPYLCVVIKGKAYLLFC